MSDYTFPCPNCTQSISATVVQAGTKIQCPACKQITVAPVPARRSSPPSSAPNEGRAGLPQAPFAIGGSGGGTQPPGELSELERQVLEGGRYVVFQYCISVLVMTFRRSSPVTFLRANESGAGPAFSYSLISLLAGWWGIPWGPIWTVTSLANNISGGKDVTEAVLAQKLGPARAAQLVSARRRPKATTSQWLWWVLGSAVALMVILEIGLLTVGKSHRRNQHETRTAGARFRSASRQIDVYRGDTGFGNSTQAVAVARKYSTNLKMLRTGLFDGGKADGFSMTHHEFLTYCELQDDKCAIIVHVPELRRFTEKAKASLGELSWLTAQSTLESQNAGKPGMKLAVALRGVAIYDRALLGVYQPGTDSTNMPSETITGLDIEERLFPWFEPVQGMPPPDSQNATN